MIAKYTSLSGNIATHVILIFHRSLQTNLKNESIQFIAIHPHHLVTATRKKSCSVKKCIVYITNRRWSVQPLHLVVLTRFPRWYYKKLHVISTRKILLKTISTTRFLVTLPRNFSQRTKFFSHVQLKSNFSSLHPIVPRHPDHSNVFYVLYQIWCVSCHNSHNFEVVEKSVAIKAEIYRMEFGSPRKFRVSGRSTSSRFHCAKGRWRRVPARTKLIFLIVEILPFSLSLSRCSLVTSLYPQSAGEYLQLQNCSPAGITVSSF